jgi:hypothetical protein
MATSTASEQAGNYFQTEYVAAVMSVLHEFADPPAAPLWLKLSANEQKEQIR